MGNATLLDRVRLALCESAYQERLGTEFVDAGDGRATVALPLRPNNTNRSGNLHGGAHASLMLSAASLATAATEREPSAQKAVSPRMLSLSYLGAVRDIGVRAEAHVVRRGRDVAHVAVVVDSDEGERIAAGTVTLGIHEDGAQASARTSAGTKRGATLHDQVAVDGGTVVEGSPFLEQSGLVLLADENDEWQSMMIPVARNEGADGTIDDGAIVGMVDNCGSLAAYTAEGVSREQLGATLSMSVAFASTLQGPVVGSGRLVAHLGSALTSEVEIWSPGDGGLRATGLVTYRIPGEHTV
jgi:uncharacterized protein (TIGR00369 family)